METERNQLLTVAICSDDSQWRDRIHAAACKILSPAYTLKIDVCSDARKLLLQPHPYHILILDLDQTPANGLEVANEIQQMKLVYKMILFTDYLPNVSRVYRIPHFSLFLKGYASDFESHLRQAAVESVHMDAPFLDTFIRGRVHRIPVNTIQYLERQGHVTYICYADHTVTQTREKIDTLLTRSIGCNLIRCHVSYAVNPDHIAALVNNSLLTKDGTAIPVSRAYLQQIRSFFDVCPIQLTKSKVR